MDFNSLVSGLTASRRGFMKYWGKGAEVPENIPVIDALVLIPPSGPVGDIFLLHTPKGGTILS